MLLDGLPWYVIGFPAAVIGGMLLLILAGYLYGVVEAYREAHSEPLTDSTQDHE